MNKLTASFLKLRKTYMDFKIRSKIMVVYLLLLVFTLSFTGLLYQRIYKEITSNKVSEVSIQTLYSIKSNITAMINDICNDSRVILSNNIIQSYLNNPNNFNDFSAGDELRKYLEGLLYSGPYISSVYIFDTHGNKFGIDKLSIKNFKFGNVKNSSWYNKVFDERGDFILRINAGDEQSQYEQGNFVSMIRMVNDLNTQKPIGILMVNITEKAFIDCYKEVANKDGTKIFILDENNNNIVKYMGKTYDDILIKQLEELNVKEYDSDIERINGQDYILSCLNVADYNWKIVSSIPFRELSKGTSIFYIVTIVVTLVNALLMFIGAIFVARLITNPINKLLKSMKGIKYGEFKKVNIGTGNDEIGQLRDGYNIMVSEIEKLINDVIDEQKRKRRAELNVLQEQIKPHFLYNTLDAMRYLALSGQCDRLHDSLEALGDYYRTSLSKGSEVITLKEEFDIAKNYLTLQKLRYGDIFSVSFELDESILSQKILKLVLQPIVENALYHGIKPKGEDGIISISAKPDGDVIRIIIEDDGVGMDEEEVDKVMNYSIDSNRSSFGLRGTIERLRIFYGIQDVYHIESRKRFGTKVTITIPLVGGGQDKGCIIKGNAC